MQYSCAFGCYIHKLQSKTHGSTAAYALYYTLVLSHHYASMANVHLRRKIITFFLSIYIN